VAERGPAADAGLAGAWLRVHDEVLAGLNHALSNRAAAAGALAAITEPHEPPGEELAGALASEAARLDALLRLFRRLPRITPARPAPQQLAEVLPVAVQLYSYGVTRSRELPCALTVEDGLLPVLAGEDALTHALVALLFGAGRWTIAGDEGRLSARASGDGTAVQVVVEGTRTGGTPAAGRELALPAAGLAEWLLGDGGARVVEERAAATVRYTLTLPTLAAPRTCSVSKPAG